MKYITDLIDMTEGIKRALGHLDKIIGNTPSVNDRLFLDLFDQAIKAATESGKLKADSVWLMERGETEEEFALGVRLNNDSVDKWREWNKCRARITQLFRITE